MTELEKLFETADEASGTRLQVETSGNGGDSARVTLYVSSGAETTAIALGEKDVARLVVALETWRERQDTDSCKGEEPLDGC